VLGYEPWERQQELLLAVAEHERVSVRSGHKVSKSRSAGSLALWFVMTFAAARVIMTSASARQVKSILWKELKLLHRMARVPLGGVMHEAPDAGLQFPDGREIVGFSTDQPERMAGISGANVLFIIDEASGVEEPIFEAIEGNRAGGARIVMFSNPTRTSGTFYESHTAKREFWHTLHISSEESPNVKAGQIIIPGLATRPWVEEKRLEWGENSPLYDVRVKGNFPSQAENAVIGLALVEAGLRRWEEVNADAPLEIGVDVARFGDDETVIWPRRGAKALQPTIVRSLNTIEVAGKVLEVVRELRREGERPRVKVDVIGYGAGTFDQLQQFKEVEAVAVNVAERATAENYAKLRDQLWFACRDWLKEGGAIPADAKLEAELVGPVYSIDTQGRYKVESKDDMKKRLGRSPDRADALCLAIYNPPKRSFGVSSGAFMDY